MFNKNKFQNRPAGFPKNQQVDNIAQISPLESERLILEIKENRRRINNLAKRILRLENYLRIRDTTDYSIIEEDNDYFK